MGIYTNKTKQKIENKIRAEDLKKQQCRDKQNAANPDDVEIIPPLVIRLTQSVGKLPTGAALQLPLNVSSLLLVRRLAQPVANFGTEPDLVLDEDDMAHAGIATDPRWLVAAV